MQAPPLDRTRGPGLTWHALLQWCALVDLAVTVAVGIALRDSEALVFSVAVVVGLGLLRVRRGLLGRIVLGLVFLDVEFWMLTAAVSNVSHHGTFQYVAVPIVLAVASLTGLVAAVAPPSGGGRGAARFVAAAGIVVVVASRRQ